MPGSGRRHLVRMRIRSQEMGWERPGVLQEEWDRVFVGGGREGFTLAADAGRGFYLEEFSALMLGPYWGCNWLLDIRYGILFETEDSILARWCVVGEV